MQSTVLSQSEIDALLSSIGAKPEVELTAEVSGKWKSVKPYDFRRPDKFSKEQLRAIQALHENFVRMAGSSLSGRLRSMINMNLSSVDQGVYQEYVKQLPATTVLGIVELEPLPGNIFIEISSDVASAITDRLLGGLGRPTARQHILTDIEITLLKGVINVILQDISDTWSNIAKISPHLKEVVLNPRYIQMAFQGDAVIILVFEIKVTDTIGTITICYPYTVLEPILDQLSGPSFMVSTGKSKSPEDLATLQKELSLVPIQLKLILGTTQVTLGDLINIQQGDIIRLDSIAGEELPVIVGKNVKFFALPGRMGSKIAAKITTVVTEKESQEVDL